MFLKLLWSQPIKCAQITIKPDKNNFLPKIINRWRTSYCFEKKEEFKQTLWTTLLSKLAIRFMYRQV